MFEDRKYHLEKQGYRIVGNHSAIKICLWCKKAIRGEDVCYKKTFYNINSWQCIQATVTLDFCNLRCFWCWRDIDQKFSTRLFNDDPKLILDGFIYEHKKILQGFFGNENVDKQRLKESMKPKHVALSLTGDACLYQRLPELIDEIHSRNMTSFLVTNGTFPSMIKKLIKHQPTQLYITLPTPNEKLFKKFCKPQTKNAWKNIQESLKLLKNFDRTVVRLTLAKDVNMVHPEQYTNILKNIKFKFLELKAAMPVGYSRKRMKFEQMPFHEEIKDFSLAIAEELNLKLISEKKESRVTLLAEKDYKDRLIK